METSWGLALRDAARAFAARRRREHGEDEAAVDEAGFTLIELMVVLLIMGILMAIAIPTFLGAASGAHDKASQSDLTNSMTSAKTVYAANGSYTTTTKAKTAVGKAEPEMTFTTSTSTKATQISVKAVTATILVLASYSPSTSTCWIGVDNEKSAPATVNTVSAPSGISYGKFTASSTTKCNASGTPTGWSRSYP